MRMPATLGEGRAGWGAMVLATAIGAVAALGQAPFDLWYLTLLAFAALMALVALAQTALGAARLMWLGGAGYFAVALSWIVQPFYVDAARDGWMAPFALVFLAGGLGLFWAAAGYIAARLSSQKIPRVLALVLLLALGGAVRSYLFTGFPWALPGHALIGTPVLQLAAYVGPHGLTLVMLAVAAAPVLAGWRGALGGAIVFAALWGAGLWQSGQPVPAREQAQIVRLIQPNAAQHLKWRADMVPVFFDRQIALTQALGSPAPDLIVWPETSIAWPLNSAGPALQQIGQAAHGAEVILGINRREQGRLFNSAIAIDSGGALTQLYDKHHLVPFGEYIPFGDALARAGVFGLAARGTGFSAGPGPQVWNLGDAGRVLPLICYEMIFPNELRGAPVRPGWVLQLTNDAWFGSFSGPYQHLAQTRLRAVEQGLPVLRSANTGVSAAIDARGQVIDSLELNTAGLLDVPLPGALPPPVYARTGDAPIVLLLCISLGVLAVRQRRRGAISR